MNIPLNSFIASHALHLFKGASVIVEHHLVHLNQGTLSVKDEHMLRKEIDELPELALVSPKLFFGLLAMFDVSSRHIPANHPSLLVAERVVTIQEPTIMPVLPQ